MGADIDEMLADPKDPRWMAYPVEFCGGTHLRNTGEAEKFVLIAEEAVAKGIRRVVGITGEAAREASARGEALRAEIARVKEAGPETVAAKVSEFQREVDESVIPVAVAIRLRQEIAELQKIAKRHGKEQAGKAADDVMSTARSLLGEAEVVGGTHVIVGEVPRAPADALRTAIDWFRQKTESSAVLLACRDDNKVTLVAGMSRDAVKKGLKAGDLIREAAPLVGGKGGGRPDLAQGGGGDPSGIPAALERAKSWLEERLR
jgi:alanyl-tRNA synthetase